jgi:hypothetical protein
MADSGKPRPVFYAGLVVIGIGVLVVIASSGGGKGSGAPGTSTADFAIVGPILFLGGLVLAILGLVLKDDKG